MDQATSQQAIFTGSVVEYNKANGWEQTDSYEGTESQCTARQQTLLSAGAIRIWRGPKGNGAFAVRGTFPYNPVKPEGNFVDTQELETSVALRSIYQSPVYRKNFGDYDAVTRGSSKADASLAVIFSVVRNYQSNLPAREDDGKYVWKNVRYPTRERAVEQELADRLRDISVANGYAFSLSNAEISAAFSLFISIAYRQLTSFIEYSSVLRRTVTSGSPAAIRANNTGAGKIWTTAELVGFEGINGAWFDLPPDAQWHKDKPRVISVYGQKTQISYSYTEIVTASHLVYEAYGTAILV